MNITRIILAIFLIQYGGGNALAQTMRMAVTTSFHNSGLAEILLPKIKSDTGIEVQLLVVGTGQALRLGRAGDVDAILVHSKNAEDEFVSKGFGIHRREIMYNDFVIIGPENDPAKIADAADAKSALSAIANTKSLFASRGDDSGTNKKELSLWKLAEIKIGYRKHNWYRATGSGMGATLNIASGLNAYALSDRASWLNFKNKGDLKIAFEGDPLLFNQYSYLPVNPKRHSHVEAGLVRKLEEWLVSAPAQKLIGEYTISNQILFTPNAKN